MRHNPEIYPDRLLLDIRVTPGARCESIDGWIKNADDIRLLRVRVRAVPDKGKANKAIVKLMSRKLGLPKSHIRLIAGERSRVKRLEIMTNNPHLLDDLHLRERGEPDDRTDY